MLENYRKEFTDFNISLNQAKCLHLSGQKTSIPITEIYNRYSDLFSLEVIASLKKAFSEIDDYYETSRKALSFLISFASENYLYLKTKNLSQEIITAENRLSIEWKGQKIPLRDINNILINEFDGQKRKEIYNKKLSLIGSLNDLRGERIEKLHEHSKELGYENYLQMFSTLHQIDYVALDTKLQKFLSDTEKLYLVNLKRYLPINLRLPIELASASDTLLFTERESVSFLFLPKRLLTSYEETFLGLGIAVNQQKNVVIDKEIKQGKHPGVFCLPITIPDKIVIMFQPSKGVKHYESFFHIVGKVGHFAFTNKKLLPEFKYFGDNALIESYGFLFRHLVNDRFWLEQMFDEREPKDLEATNLLVRLYLIRRYIAKLNYEITLHSKGVSSVANLYAQNVSESTAFQTNSTEYLVDHLDSFYTGSYLRAMLFEPMFRDYLKTHFGYKWWQSRKAGNLLKEMWDVGTRYSLEEFAKQLGLGELAVESLESEFFIGLKT